MKKICSQNFVRVFRQFENRLNAIFQRNTELVEGGNVRSSRQKDPYRYKKKLISKENVTVEIRVVYDKVADDYLYYSYNIFFENSKLMFHYEPTHKEHFQPHINVYVGGEELRNTGGEGIHILSHKYHPFEILALLERYFV